MSDRVRVGIVGARRRRQGLGPYMARFFHELGAEVVAVLGTSEESAGAAATELRSCGIAAKPYADPTEFFSASDLNAVAIASPHESHAPCLELALEHGKHVLCEKPFVWGTTDPVADSARLVAGFVDTGLVLRENVQWPYTLAAYRQLYPDGWRPGDRATTLDFLLGPAARDSGRITDSLSHVLSLLQVLTPLTDAPLESVDFEAGSDAELTLRFEYPGEAGAIATRVMLRHAPTPPRPAGYGIDGRFAHRQIDPETYRMSFHDRDHGGGRRVSVPDPMAALIADFIRDVSARDAAASAGAHSTGPAHVVRRLGALVELYDAYRARFSD